MYCFCLACKTIILTEWVEEICLSLLGILCELSDCFFIPSFSCMLPDHRLAQVLLGHQLIILTGFPKNPMVEYKAGLEGMCAESIY